MTGRWASRLLVGAQVTLLVVVCSLCLGAVSARSGQLPTRTCESADMLPEGQVQPHGPGTYVLSHVWFAGQVFPGWYQGAALRSAQHVTKSMWWIKVGLNVEAGHPVTVRVPVQFRRSYQLGWDRTGTALERFVPCAADSTGRWTFFAGGFLYERPVCAPLQVNVDGRSATVRFGLGRNCPA
jgi:hypothetical protein